jgi:hypothetical protein
MTRGIAQDLTKQRFGRLEVLERTASDKQGNAQWICKCDCGNVATIRGSFLLKRQVVCSRGCPLNPAAKVKDIEDQVFGELTAIEQVGNADSGKAIWRFLCSCGKEVQVPSDRVLNSNMKSCGGGTHRKTHGLSRTRGYKSMHFMKYMAAKRSRTPPWLTETDLQSMIDLYREAERLTKETGVLHEVDHIYPLQGRKVSGFHVPLNLEIKTRSENRRKSNKHPDDVC